MIPPYPLLYFLQRKNRDFLSIRVSSPYPGQTTFAGWGNAGVGQQMGDFWPVLVVDGEGKGFYTPGSWGKWNIA